MHQCRSSLLPEKKKLMPIPGTVPQLTALPPGCAFEPRCPFRRTDCVDAVPELQRLREPCRPLPLGLSWLKLDSS
jgi:oligopeptide/dipeptide ABC transporter ATP-binding protein